jgi:hypothetical protein
LDILVTCQRRRKGMDFMPRNDKCDGSKCRVLEKKCGAPSQRLVLNKPMRIIYR